MRYSGHFAAGLPCAVGGQGRLFVQFEGAAALIRIAALWSAGPIMRITVRKRTGGAAQNWQIRKTPVIRKDPISRLSSLLIQG